MSPSSIEPGELLDLKLMPAWVKETSIRQDYADYEGEDREQPRERQQGRKPRREKLRHRAGPPPEGGAKRRDRHQQVRRHGKASPFQPPKDRTRVESPLQIAVQFLPRTIVLDNVIAQIKASSLAYSLFFLARSFLEKPQRYEVALKAAPESAFYRLGDSGAISVDRAFLEANAFRLSSDNFYSVEVTQSEPLKGNFLSIARCRLSGTVLGPTNHHDYQRRLRGLYEQRFSRRMSFADYQRQIEIVGDPAAVEQWKEEARKVTTFVTTREETPQTFSSAVEAERNFRQRYLSELLHKVEEVVIDGLTSRQVADRRLHRHIEQAWSNENRSPSNLMQELARKFRDAGLHIFRHRRGMLFVSSVRIRPFVHDEQSVSAQVKAILELVGASPRIRRKEVADKLLVDAGDNLDARKLALASDLHWLISEGHVIEFNDGTLDLPRVKTKPGEQPQPENAAEEPRPEQAVKVEQTTVEGTEASDSDVEASPAPATEETKPNDQSKPESAISHRDQPAT